MKRFIFCLIISLLPLSIEATDYYTVTADVLNIRNEPSKNGDVIGVVRNGQTVSSDSQASSGWIRIKASSLSGYVNTDYLKFSHSTDNDVSPKKTTSKSRIGGWGWAMILLTIAVIGRLLRSQFEIVDGIICIIVIIASIIVWISNGFWMGVLTFFGGSFCFGLLFGMGGDTQIRRYGHRYTLKCDKCGYEKLTIVEEFEGGVTTKCKRCGDVVAHILNH